MSPRARSKQANRLWRRTWTRQHARAIRRRARQVQEDGPVLAECRAFLYAWAVAQDGHVDALPQEEQAIYYRRRGSPSCLP